LAGNFGITEELPEGL